MGEGESETASGENLLEGRMAGSSALEMGSLKG